jgi:hypothetical protein
MNRIAFTRQEDPPPLPCQYFHLICGTGTGGQVQKTELPIFTSLTLIMGQTNRYITWCS